jgi:hypothetical protein
MAAVPSKIPFTFSICQGHAQLKWPWKWVPYNFLMSSLVTFKVLNTNEKLPLILRFWTQTKINFNVLNTNEKWPLRFWTQMKMTFKDLNTNEKWPLRFWTQNDLQGFEHKWKWPLRFWTHTKMTFISSLTSWFSYLSGSKIWKCFGVWIYTEW